MPKKKTLEEVTKAFEKVGYKILDNKYINSKAKINFICDKGHKSEITWFDFNAGCRCKSCSYEKRANKRKKPFDEVKRIFSNAGLTLLSTEYINSKTPLKFICNKNGHTDSIRLGSIIAGKGCKQCALEKSREAYRRPFSEVVELFNSEGYTILSPESEYVNSHTKIKCLCPVGHKTVIQIYHFINGSRCKHCSKGSPSRASEKWLNYLEDNLGYKLIREYPFNPLTQEKADGYDPSTNTIYEFLGDYWHGNPKIFSAGKINSNNKKPFGQLYKETIQRINYLKTLEYNVVYVWESDFNKKNKKQ